jgi:putative hydrolase of the HAD superfamily
VPDAIEAVIFDYGGVLSSSPWLRMAELEQRLGLPSGTISQIVGYGLDVPEPVPGDAYTNPWHLLEIGAIGVDDYTAWANANATALFGTEVDLRESMLSAFANLTILWPMVHEARRLRARGFRLGLCTNNIEPIRALWKTQLPLDLFDAVVDSSEEGVRKPDPRIYLITCERLGSAPEQCVFVDDHPANVRAAEALGMRGVLVVGDDVLRAIDDLEAVLTAAPNGAIGSVGC